MDKTTVISGQALIGEEIELSPVDVVIENGIIAAIEENSRGTGYLDLPGVLQCPHPSW